MNSISCWFFALTLLVPCLIEAQNQPVTVTVAGNGAGPNLSPGFLGLSYESSMLLPENDQYYFDPDDRALVNTFKTLGIKNLRVGANAVDDPHVPIPGPRDIDTLFEFARAAGVKVIYSFRLKKGDPVISARLATYIAAHYEDALDCFAIGNEPSFYLKTFPAYFAQWKPHYEAILKAVPNAMFDGPSVAGAHYYAVDFANVVFPGGHLAMASDHYYFLGSGRAGEIDPAATRTRFLQDSLHAEYEKDYASVGAVLAAHGIPYRIDEMNSCYNGGARGASDTYASTLWALDCTHWWAARHILGVNYHTGESVGRDGGFGAANYAAFVHQPDGKGFVMRPQAYALLAFTQAARGRPLDITLQTSPDFNFDAYAYRENDDSFYLTLINKSFGDHAKTAAVGIQWPGGGKGRWQRMDLVQENHDIAAKTGVTLGGAAIDPDGTWHGKWKKVKVKHAKSGHITVQVPPASAAILRFLPAK
ncbi:MAG: glycosyl hydrolase family 79 C-terminal domain-containing protein [Limisphaerales bacterium]